MEQEQFSKIIKQIESFNPQFIRGYPAPLHFLSSEIKNNSFFNCDSLIAINTTGSTLHSSTRKTIESAFGRKVYDSYSCEGGTIFAQCENLHNYHPAEEYAISEFIADEFTNSDPDKAMKHITTDLHNFAFPFIRYDTQDYLSLGSKQVCPCGRNYINVLNIKGRDSDILVTPSGKYIIAEHFAAYFEWIPEVEQYQVVQDIRDSITINLVVNGAYSSKVRKNLYDHWNSVLGDDIKLTIKTVDSILLTPTGKRRNVIRNPKIHLS